jgi:hypothetical protein
MKRALIGAVAVAVAAFATPALAQAVIKDSSYCAQFYPDANCPNLAAGNPPAERGYWGSGNAMAPSYFAQSAEPNAYRYHGGPKFND